MSVCYHIVFNGCILFFNDLQRVTTVFLPKESELQKFESQPWWSDDIADRVSAVAFINLLLLTLRVI